MAGAIFITLPELVVMIHLFCYVLGERTVFPVKKEVTCGQKTVHVSDSSSFNSSRDIDFKSLEGPMMMISNSLSYHRTLYDLQISKGIFVFFFYNVSFANKYGISSQKFN